MRIKNSCCFVLSALLFFIGAASACACNLKTHSCCSSDQNSANRCHDSNTPIRKECCFLCPEKTPVVISVSEPIPKNYFAIYPDLAFQQNSQLSAIGLKPLSIDQKLSSVATIRPPAQSPRAPPLSVS